MMIRARCFQQQPAKQGLIRVAELQQLAGRCQIEQGFNHRLKTHGHNAADHTAGSAHQAVAHDRIQICGGHESYGDHGQQIQGSHDEAAQNHTDTLRLPLQEKDRCNAADDGRQHHIHQFRGIGGGTAQHQRRCQHRQRESAHHADACTQQCRQQHNA